MAVEIKELIIRAVAVDEADTNKHSAEAQDIISPEMKAQIIQQSVKEVLRIIERKSSR